MLDITNRRSILLRFLKDLRLVISNLFGNGGRYINRGILIAEQNSPLMANKSKHHDTVKNTNAQFKSGTKTAHEIEALVDGIKLFVRYIHENAGILRSIYSS